MEILEYLPEKIENTIKSEVLEQMNKVEEIRLRAGQPIVLKLNDGEKIIRYLVSTEEILTCIQNICENSIYSYQNQIACGFITINGGHRVGISGSCVMEESKVKNINYIYSLNIRIAKEVIGCSNKIVKDVINLEENTIYNTLIASSPGARKDNNIKRLNKTVK